MNAQDVCVIGGGVGGVACAQTAASLGLKATLVSAGPLAGRSRALAAMPRRRIGDRPLVGTAAGEAFAAWQEASVAASDAQHDAVTRELHNRGVHVVQGAAKVESAAEVAYSVRVGPTTVACRKVVLAVGVAAAPPDVDGAAHFTPWSALIEPGVPMPRRLVVVGDSPYAVEIATVLAGFGIDMVLAFGADDVLPGFDDDLRRRLGDLLVAAGVRLRPQARLLGLEATERGVEVITDDGAYGGDLAVLAPDHPGHVRLGRLGLDNVGLRADERGVLYVNRHYESSNPGLFAIGDCADHAGNGDYAGTFDLVSVARAEGEAVAHYLATGRAPALDYELVARAVRGPLDAAAIGYGEAAAVGAGFDVRSGFVVKSGESDVEQFIKLVSDGGSGRVLGCHAIGEGARELVTALAPALHGGLTTERLAAILPAHPTLAEEMVAIARSLS